MKLPDFIIVGATKCGTTALWYNIDKHPAITMAMKSATSFEMNFFGGKKTKFIVVRRGENENCQKSNKKIEMDSIYQGCVCL